MIYPAENSPSALSSDNLGTIIVELDGAELAEGPADPEKRRALDLALRRMGEAYLEKLKKYRPEEYVKIVKPQTED